MRGDSFVYAGDEAGAASLVRPATSQYQLNGALVIPGIIDAHTHLVARSADTVELAHSQTRSELMTEIAAMIKHHPDRKILVGGGWDNDLFGKTGPHKSDLDRIESARPVVLYDSWGHSLWANSKALEIAGVDRDTPDVIPGLAFYQRDELGEPSR